MERCPFCGTAISPGFGTCASCGAQRTNAGSSGVVQLIIMVFGVNILGMGVWWAYNAVASHSEAATAIVILSSLVVFLGVKVIAFGWKAFKDRSDVNWVRR
jgi:hypothetical protein